jgi:GTP-binding protein
MKINKAVYEGSAVKKEQYPKGDLPEIAFVGRSNVGKSSLINSLVNRKNLVKTSSKPGKTRTINFFKINDNFRFVDLPGYGYAAVSSEIKEQWAVFIEEYLKDRDSLKLVIQLVDVRHEPTSLDIRMNDWLRHFNIPTLIVATKIDKISKNHRIKQLSIIRKKLSLSAVQKVIPFSAITKEGKMDIWKVISEYLD